MQLAFSNRFKLKDHPNIIAGIDTANTMYNLYKLREFPATAIYTKEGKLSVVYKGATNFEKILAAAIKE